MNISDIFDVVVALVIMPVGWYIKNLSAEVKELTILIYNTREQYVNKSDLKYDMDRLIEMMQRMDDKLDRISSGV
tara:strand:+ start:1235 stop:1459 length:225 start_codon:yes stop_codon:yes gene_type:complete